MKSLILLIIFSLPLYSQWLDIASPVTTTLRDVCFADSLNGWAVGDTSTIIHTSDGGYNWVIQYCPLSNLNLNRVQFVNKEIGFIVARKGVILKTNDSGVTWASFITDSLLSYNGLHFINSNTGWVAGGGGALINRDYGIILGTIDGGVTWEKQYETDTTNIYLLEDNFKDIKFINAQFGYAFAGIGGTYLYTTTDGGINWNKKGLSLIPLYDIGVVSRDTVWGCGGGFASTVDNGFNWIYNGVLGGNVLDLAMVNANSGYILAARLEEQKLMFTQDMGETFSDTWVYQGHTLGAMSLNAKNNFICLVGSSGRIVMNKNFLTDIHDTVSEYLNGFDLYQNYPNPFNPTTTISYNLPNISGVELRIYDLLGEEVKSFIFPSQSAGVQNIIWNGTNNRNEQVVSGIYIYRIKAISLEGKREVFEKSAKMIFLK
jgi:photosystem II stability/assembly factor-like uncharacterized protein